MHQKYPYWLRAPLAVLIILTACSEPQGLQSASEGQLNTLSVFTVDTLADELDGSCSDGSCSLRDALALVASGGTIAFAAGLADQTITLTQGELVLSTGLTLDASGAPGVTVSGNGSNRVFRIPYLEFPYQEVILDGLIITGGNAGPGGQGGGILNHAGLTVRNSVITGNTAGEGGGIYSDNFLKLEQTTVRDNTADTAGGGIYLASPAEIWYSTLSGNAAPVGGGLYADNGALFANSTVSGNFSGGGIRFENGETSSQFIVASTTVANNKDGGLVTNLTGGTLILASSLIASQASGSDCSLTIESGSRDETLGYNLDSDGSCSFVNPSDISNGTADLRPLQLNAPGRTATHALGPASEAIDRIPSGAGFCDTELFDDQRGATRPSGNGCDIGAYEVQVGGSLDDGDGIAAEIDGEYDETAAAYSDQSTIFSASFTDKHLAGTTSGEILDRGDLEVRITRNVELGAIRIATIGETGDAPASFYRWCDFADNKIVTLSERSVLDALCGSLELWVEEGSAAFRSRSGDNELTVAITADTRVKLSEPIPGDSAQVIELLESPEPLIIMAMSGEDVSTFKISEGAHLQIDEPVSEGASYTIENLSSEPVTITYVSDTGEEQPQTLGAGEAQVANAPPQVDPIVAPTDPVRLGDSITATSEFTDLNTSDAHTAFWSWGDGTSTGPVEVSQGRISAENNYSQPGVYTVTLEISDGNSKIEVTSGFVVVYDPDGGFVTGGGWIDSSAQACKDTDICVDATGKANFGFVSKYKKGATVPTGNTVFQFKAGDLDFRSDTQEWLVVNQGGTNAQFKGSGTINGQNDANGNPYEFMIWAGDDNPDTFRIRIWSEESGGEYDVYDNGVEQPIGGGSIVIHTR